MLSPASATAAPSRSRTSAEGDSPAAVRARSTLTPKELSLIATRSLARVVRASGQPPFTSPTTQSSGTKTSSRKTSLNSASPVSSRSGRIVIPGVAMSSRT